MSLAIHLRRINPRLWFFFKFLRYKYLKAEPEFHALRDFVPRGRMAIDAGSSIGLYSRALARLVPKVVAFEANPAVATLARTVAPRNVQVVNIALAAVDGIAKLRIPLNARGDTTDDLATVAQENDLGGKTFITVDVPTRRLDGLGYTDCGFIKIDVEGHEEAVLDGAQRVIETNRPVLMIELAEQLNAGSVARVTGRLARLSYAGFFMWRRQWRPIAEFRLQVHQNWQALVASPPRRRQTEFAVNFVFVPREAIPPAMARGVATSRPITPGTR